MNRLVEDLRFCIGVFFMIVGILLVLQGVLVTVENQPYNFNLITGLVFIGFACCALYLSRPRGNPR